LTVDNVIPLYNTLIMVVVDALRYKSQCSGFDSRGGHWCFSFT